MYSKPSNSHTVRTKKPVLSFGLVIFLVAILLLTACSSETSQTEQAVTEPVGSEDVQQPQAPADANLGLVNTTWVLVGYGEAANPTVVEDGTLVTVFFLPDGSLNGSGGCNTYNTSYQVNGDQLTIASPIASTMMACEKGGEQETVYLAALQQAKSYQITEQGNLNIKYDSGAGYEEVLTYIHERAPLEGTMWTLISMGPADNLQPPVAGANFTAQFLRDPNFPTGALVGGTGCSDYRSSYYASQNEIKINLPGATANTECPAGLPEQEQAYYQALNTARSYRIVSQTMQIFYGDQVLNFAVGGTPAPAATETPTAGELAPLNATKWWLNSIDTVPLIPGTEITAEFAINPDGVTGTISGFSGCNNYTGDVTGVFTVINIIPTQSACDQAVMDQETTYLSALGTSNSITYDPVQLLVNTQFGVLGYGNTPEPAPPIPTEAPVQPTETSEAPVVIISASPDPTTVAGTTIFDGSQSYSGVDIVSYTWDFGDGVGAAEGAAVEYVYQAAGVYNVTLTVQDSNGQLAAGQYPITVE